MAAIRILVIEPDTVTQVALGHILDSDYWSVEMTATPDDALRKLAAGGWQLIIANLTTRGLASPLFDLLRQLAEAQGPVRVLFLVPFIGEFAALRVLERLRLPYATKPLHLHSFLELVTDLLHEAGALPGRPNSPRSRPAAPPPNLKKPRHRANDGPLMFVSRDDYFDYDEDELRRLEEEEEERRRLEREKHQSTFSP